MDYLLEILRIVDGAAKGDRVTVGSLAHLDRPNSVVKAGEPSPFSRRGPGAAFLPKPDICHYGGNCDPTGDYQQVGVISVDGSGNLSEAIGTSFSTPLAASVLANIQAGVTERISRNLAKALMIHSAALENGPIQKARKARKFNGHGDNDHGFEVFVCCS